MSDGDEQVDIDAEDVNIDARRVIVNTGWSVEMARWNTIGTVAGALVGCASLVLSGVAIWLAMR